MKIARPYQEKAQASIHAALERDRSTVLELATGLGKTFVASRVILARQPARSLFLANTDELIDQAVADITENTGLDVEVEKADRWATIDLFQRMPVVVSSIQTQCSGKPDRRRYMRFQPTDFDLIICDEAHFSISPTWRETLKWYQQNPKLKILGLTATPKRHDGKAMGQVYESVAMRYGILDGIADGWLVDIVQQSVSVSGLDFSHIKTSATENGPDLNKVQLAEVMEQERNVQEICQPIVEAMFGLEPKTLHSVEPEQWKEYLRALNKVPRRTLVYTVSVAQAELFARVFLRALDGIEWLCGKTNKEDRRKMILRFASGVTHGLVNVGCLTHGFNNPAVELIGMARPTKSASLYLQILGRGTRTLPGVIDALQTASAEERRAAIAASAKPFIRLMDFKGNAGHHKIVSCVDVLGGRVCNDAVEKARLKMDDGKPRKILVTMSNLQMEIERANREARKRAAEAAVANREHALARSDYSIQNVPLDSHHSIAMKLTSRDGRRFTPWQVKVLLDEGKLHAATLSYRQGCAIYGKLMKIPSPRMKAALARAHYTADEIRAMSRDRAKEIIGNMEANNWRRPPEPVSRGQAARLKTLPADEGELL